MMMLNPAKNYIEWSVPAAASDLTTYKSDLYVMVIARAGTDPGFVEPDTTVMLDPALLLTYKTHNINVVAGTAEGTSSVFYTTSMRGAVNSNVFEGARTINGSDGLGGTTYAAYNFWNAKLGENTASADGDGAIASLTISCNGAIAVGGGAGATAAVSPVDRTLTTHVSANQAGVRGFYVAAGEVPKGTASLGHNGAGAFDAFATQFVEIKPKWAP